MECFKKVLKLAEVVNSSQPTNKNIGLYVAILNKFIYFLEDDSFDAVLPELQSVVSLLPFPLCLDQRWRRHDLCSDH